MKRGIRTIVSAVTAPVILSLASAGSHAADSQVALNALMTMCVGGGSEETLRRDGQVDAALTLEKIRTGKVGAGVSGNIAYSKTEWQGLIGGINAQIGMLQASQADKVRECTKPYIAGILAGISQAK